MGYAAQLWNALCGQRFGRMVLSTSGFAPDLTHAWFLIQEMQLQQGGDESNGKLSLRADGLQPVHNGARAHAAPSIQEAGMQHRAEMWADAHKSVPEPGTLTGGRMPSEPRGMQLCGPGGGS